MDEGFQGLDGWKTCYGLTFRRQDLVVPFSLTINHPWENLKFLLSSAGVQ